MKVRTPRSFVLFATYVSLVASKTDHCPAGCQLALSHVSFSDVNASSGYYTAQCESRLRVTSVFVCIRQYCHVNSLQDARTRLNGPCERYANITLPPVSIVDGFSDADIENLPRFGRREFDHDFETNEIAIPDDELYGLALRSQDAWSNSVKTRMQYGYAMIHFWLIVVLIGLGCRIQSTFPTRLAKSLCSSDVTGRIWSGLKRWLLVPATVSTRCAEPYGWFTVPPRLQSLILLTFTILNIILCCINYEVFDGNLNWPEPVQWSRYIADRTGVISIANLPLIWLFAIRNNLLLAITGWSFETAMQFHRWVARISTVEAIVHSLAYTVIVFQTGDWTEYAAYWRMRYWAMGGLATVAMSLICVFSIYPMRQQFYELFLIIHMSLGALTLLGMWYHVEIFDGAYNWYIWPCVLTWLLDRIGRACRLIYVNYGSSLSNLEYSPESNAIWLTVPNCLIREPRPGEYYFLYLFKDRSFYESHPFTLSSWDKSGLHFLVRPYNGFTERLAGIGQLAYGVTKSNVSCKVRILAEGPYGATSNLHSFDSLIFVVGGTGIAVALAYLTDLCEGMARRVRPYQARKFKIILAVQHEAFFRHIYEGQIEPKLQLLSEMLEADGLCFVLEVFVTRASTVPQPDPKNPDIKDLPTASRIAQNEDRNCRHDSELFGTLQSNHKIEEAASECSSLLTPRTRSPVLEALTAQLDAVPIHDSPSAKFEQIFNYRIPNNTSLNIHRQQRPEISSLIHEACSNSSTAQFPDYESHNVDAADRLLISDSKKKSKTVVVCCGPGSLADATRAAVVKTLAMETAAQIEFINESYSW